MFIAEPTPKKDDIHQVDCKDIPDEERGHGARAGPSLSPEHCLAILLMHHQHLEEKRGRGTDIQRHSEVDNEFM